jgi:two-component system, LuxR family, sensor kinase FixL
MADYADRPAARSLPPMLAALGTDTDTSRYAARIALAVFAAYYMGARLGLALTFEPLPVSVLWPPNAILFAALLLVPTRMWWVVCAAALPAHLVSELQGGIPLTMVVCWYVSNVAEAVIGASAVRMLIGQSQPFATPRNVIMFLLAAIVAATLSSFLDAAFVKLNNFHANDYWTIWSTRLFSNITSDLVVVPVITTCMAIRMASIRHAGPARLTEAMFLILGLAATTFFAFDSEIARGSPPAVVCLPVPFLLWAAFRLGPAGASAAFTFVSLSAILGAGHGVGVLGARDPIENAHSVQLFVLCIAPTLLCLAAAIEERKGGVESLRLSDKRFQLVLEATRDTVYERDMETGTLWWSRDGPSHLGYARWDDLRNFTAFAEIIHPEDRERAIRHHENAARDGHPLWETEFRVRRADGSYAHVHEQGFIVRDRDGNAVQMIGTLADVTERHDTEELSQRLAHASRLTAMGELAASIAHEINQPMSAILNNVDAAELVLDAEGLERTELREILDDIRSDDLRASEIVRHIRNLANKRGVEFETFDLNQLMQSVQRLVIPAARRRGVTLRMAFGEIPPVHADSIHVQQVLLNLIFNGMDAMADLPVEERQLLAVSGLAQAGMVQVTVCDRGHGIAPGQLEKIFDSFYTTKSDGMGLGLSIARSLVHAHGGRIWAENNADRGATVGFTLPAHPRA